MTRRKNDAYYTPEWATEELLKYISLDWQSDVLEPCSGEGNISSVLRKRVLNIDTNDVDPQVSSFMHFDYLEHKFAPHDCIITNPPFSFAFEFLEKAWRESRVGVAFLLRLSFLEPTYDRGDYLHKLPPNKLIVLPRISFTGNGKTDSVTTAWTVWEHDSTDQQIIIVPKKKQ